MFAKFHSRLRPLRHSLENIFSFFHVRLAQREQEIRAVFADRYGICGDGPYEAYRCRHERHVLSQERDVRGMVGSDRTCTGRVNYNVYRDTVVIE
jgi:hypothetical protein